jgi:iron only hydrogenase large subunit-like protein
MNGHFHHALKVLDDVCTGCTHCMKVCPTNAIRIRDGLARISDNHCIDCGECYKACPVHAIIVDQDDFNRILDFKYKAALVPSVLIGQFARNISIEKIYQALKKEGFTHVFEAEAEIEALNEAIFQFQGKSHFKPVVSSFCPAIVRLIQVQFPSLAENIMPIKAPLDLTALSIRKQLGDQGIPPHEVGIFYITPCAAKIAAIKSPEGEEESNIDGVINMDFIFNKLFSRLSKDDITEKKEDGKHDISAKTLCWALTNGESIHANGRSLAIDGVKNSIEFLERIENNEHSHFDFLELRVCDQGCPGGILMTSNRFLVTERIKERARKAVAAKQHGPYHSFLLENAHISKIQPRSILKLDDDIEVAMVKMQRIRNLMCFLPGIDCGACGAPSCKSLAEDIVQRKAAVSDCVFIQKNMLKHGKLSVEHSVGISEKTWGKDKFEKDCTKKGAKNEGF